MSLRSSNKLFLFLFFFSSSLWADSVSRRNWILEQLSTPVGQASVQGVDSDFRFSANLTNYSDAVSGMLGVLADLGPLEVAGYASHRYFTAFTDAGREYKDASQQDSDSFAGEVARAFMTREGHFGRGSAQFIYFPKNNSSFLRLGVNMGIFEFGDSPWLLRLNTHIYFPVRVEQSWTYSVQVEIGQTVSQLANSRWRLGLFLGWTYKTREETFFPDKGNLTDTLRLEHMLFSIGPWLEYATNYYNLKVGLPWRVWLDKESALANDGTRIFHYPSDTKLPDLQVNLSLYF